MTVGIPFHPIRRPGTAHERGCTRRRRGRFSISPVGVRRVPGVRDRVGQGGGGARRGRGDERLKGVAPVRFIVPEVTIEISEADAWRLTHALRGEGVANDPSGGRLADLIEGKIKGSAAPITLDDDQQRALFAALDLLRDTEPPRTLSPEMHRLREAIGYGLGALPAPPPPNPG